LRKCRYREGRKLLDEIPLELGGLAFLLATWVVQPRKELLA
jgi:hypothetical protein